MQITSLYQGNPLRHAAAWIALCAVFLVALCSPVAHAETKTVVAEGSTDVCFGREAGMKIARTATINDAYRECHALGAGWSFTKNQFSGYEQCTRCGKSEEFRCTVKQAVYICTNMQKERREKAAKERAEKVEVARLAKEKAEREKLERESLKKAAKEKTEQERAKKQAAAKLAGEKAERDRSEKLAAAKREQDKAGRETNLLDGASPVHGQAKSMDDLLDASAERSLVKNRLARERAVYRTEASEVCRAAMSAVDACYAKTSCKRPAEQPSASECKNIPPYPRRGGGCNPFCLTRAPGPGDVCYREDAECRAFRAEEERTKILEKAELQRSQSQWESSYGALSKICEQRGKEREGFTSCQKQYGSTCNPKGYEGQNACVEHRLSTFGPTEQQARALLKKEWDANARVGKNPAVGKKNTPAPNFLD